jgi:DNA-binding XRE family transcriptional regulator
MKRGDEMKRKNLMKFRIDLGLKSKEMAEKLGITKTRYSNLENGKVEPSMDLLYKFQEVFEVDDVLELLKVE